MRSFILIITFSLILGFVQAQETINLYKGIAPGSEKWKLSEKVFKAPNSTQEIYYNISTPTLTAYLPLKYKATGTSVLIAPGGAFHILSMDNEGHEVAKFLQSKGIAAFVLKYRTVPMDTDDPFAKLMKKMGDFKKLDEENAPVIELAIADAKEAVRHIRNNAIAYDIDPNKLGIMGFSAGGTLALGTTYASDSTTLPNFIAPIYPYTAAVDYLKKIPKQKTPIFITVASDDQLGFAPANIQLYADWKAAGQPAELHVYEKGGHGFGMNIQKITTDTWHERFTDWLKMQGLLKKRHPGNWEKQFTEVQLEEMSKKNAEREKRDWTNLSRYKEDNLKSKKKPKVVFIGDSITEAWVNINPSFFEQNNLIGRGIGGQTSPQLILRFRQDVIDLQPKVVVINIGINDIAENTGEYQEQFTLGNIKSMVELAKANKIKVIVGAVLPATAFPWRTEIKNVPTKVMALNAAIKELCLSENISFVDYFNALKDEQNGLSPDMASDGVHPNKKCYAIMEKLVLESIEKVIKSTN